MQILLYGPPGTGKTEFAKVLAREVGTDLRAVGETDDDGGEASRRERLAELTMASRMLGQRSDTVLLFDEMEDLFGTGGFPFGRKTPSKVHFNRILETNPVPVSWTTNSVNACDPAFLRRISYSAMMRPPSGRVRARIWQRLEQLHGTVTPLAELAEQLKVENEFEGPQAFWMDAFCGQPADICTHPAILAAARLIESYAERNEKVLVFGRFIAPMNALTRMLDVREMLRRLRDGQHWPTAKVRDESEPAVLAAMNDPDLYVTSGGIIAINQMLTERYKKWSTARRTELARLHREIDALAPQDDIAALLVSLLRQDDDGEELQGEIGPLLEALGDRRNPRTSIM